VSLPRMWPAIRPRRIFTTSVEKIGNHRDRVAVQSVDPGNADREDIRPDQVGDEATIARSSVVRWVSTVRTDRPRT